MGIRRENIKHLFEEYVDGVSPYTYRNNTNTPKNLESDYNKF